MGGFDWPAMRRRALGQLGLKPAEFWALTPVEFLEMLGVEPAQAPMGRAGFEALMQAFPDERRDDDDTR
ncbi:MAG: phage tail assembly chaperone [Mangrovicoccus sp.]|nr:phage tail assembly chaperone [Mangrovicoccus sp.]